MSTGNWEPVRLLDVSSAPFETSNKGVEADDPLEMIGVNYPSDPETDRLAARCMVEEYALIGFSAADIRALFASPNYVALHALFLRYGPEFVDESIAAVFTVREPI